MIHLAAHAVVDDDHPERSAVVLAPGDGEEDGLLQASEIAGLDLRGKVVILSACRTASGAVLEGEGVMGLARAFFEAGARAVVGSLWPLRDDDAAALMEQLSRELARGQPVAAALADARRERLAAGAPTAAWAGLVVLGDGDAAPLAARRGEAGAAPRWLWWLVPTAVLAGAGFLAYRVVRRIRNPQGCSATR